MQVRAAGTTGRAHQPDFLSSRHYLAGFDEHRRHVPVDCMEAVAVVDLDVNPVGSPAGKDDLPRAGDNLGRSPVVGDVDPRVVFVEVLGYVVWGGTDEA